MFQLNSQLQPMNSPIANRPKTFYLDPLTELQTNYIKSSQINLTKFAVLSNVSAAVTGDMLEQNNSITMTTTLSKVNPPDGYKNLAVPFISAYEGTAAVGTLQIYPSTGSGGLVGDYDICSGYDYASYSGTNSVFKVTIERTAAGSAHVYFLTQWKYFESSGKTALS